jgi:hypothetical protein
MAPIQFIRKRLLLSQKLIRKKSCARWRAAGVSLSLLSAVGTEQLSQEEENKQTGWKLSHKAQ